jgi:hypothetical protein
MNALEQLREYRWRTDEFPVCSVNVRVAELSRRLGFQEESWNEDGLGKATGFLCRAPSGLIILARELEHAVQHFGDQGPTLYIEADDVMRRGVQTAVNEVLEALSLPESSLTWSQQDSAPEAAREAVARAEQKRRGP